MNFSAFKEGGQLPKSKPSIYVRGSEVFDLNKMYPDLKHTAAAFGWDTKGNDEPAEVDIYVLLADSAGRITNPSAQVLFFGQKSQQGIHFADAGKLQNDSSDNAKVCMDLDSIPHEITSILFYAGIFRASEREQDFGMLKDVYIRLLDEDNDGRELLRFPLGETDKGTASVRLARLERSGDGWLFEACGNGMEYSDLNDIIANLS